MTLLFRHTALGAVLSIACALAACEPARDPSAPTWGGGPTGTKRASAKGASGESLSLHPHVGGTDKSQLGVGGPASDKTRTAASNGGQTPKENECAGKPDGAARCQAETIHVCVGGAEYMLDCDKFAQNDGWDGGECVETDARTDCFGCDAHFAGSSSARTCCDVTRSTACCDEGGVCWKP